VAKRKIASISPVTGAPVAGFTANAGAQATALAATNTTVYVGGNFSTVNGAARVGLAALNAGTGAVLPGFVNDISGGIGPNGALTVQQLKLTHDDSKLLVVHTGRRIAGQDRYGVGLISAQTNKLLGWRTRLWDDNLQFVGGIQRVYAGDVAPNDQFFVVGSGSGGDRPPINDTAVAFPVAGGDDVQPLWVSRHFDSVYSVAVTERAVYVGGHFGFQESPTAPDPWPGLDNVGYGTGQGLAGYGLGDAVVRRDHLGALDPATGKALEWNPGSNSFEGNKAMEATGRGLFVGGDGMYQGGRNTGRVAFYDLATNPAPSPIDTTVVNPIEGRVVPAGVQFVIDGRATAPGRVRRVQVEIQDRNTKRYLQDDLVTWGAANTLEASLATANATAMAWSLPVTVTGNRELQILARTVAVTGGSDTTKAVKKFESFGIDDQTPTTSITGPSGGVLASTTFVATGTASDDKGVNALSYWFRDDSNRYLQDDGSVAAGFNTFRGAPDVVGATSATGAPTWSRAGTASPRPTSAGPATPGAGPRRSS
jgi:trimeric autotransporter adhesin